MRAKDEGLLGLSTPHRRARETRIPDDSKTDYYKFACKNRLYQKLRLLSKHVELLYLVRRES
jgi:hypothetical protein